MRAVVIMAAALAVLAPMAGAGAQDAAKAVIGKWEPPEQDSAFEIYPCEQDRYCGKISMIKEPNLPDGSPKVDLNNQDASQRGQPILGMIFLSGFRYDGNGGFEDGRIYNPRDGKVYRANMKLEDNNNRLRVRGYVGMPLLGQTQVWTRAR